jgi:hypothetical protein
MNNNVKILVNFSTPIPLARAECDDSLPFSGASSIPPYHILFPATLLYQLFHCYILDLINSKNSNYICEKRQLTFAFKHVQVKEAHKIITK